MGTFIVFVATFMRKNTICCVKLAIFGIFHMSLYITIDKIHNVVNIVYRLLKLIPKNLAIFVSCKIKEVAYDDLR